MKLFLFYFFFISTFAIAQNRNFIVIGNDTKKPIEQANVDFGNGRGVYSHQSGSFAVPKSIDSITISFVGYKKKKVKVSTLKDTVLMNISTEKLTEVSIKKQNRNYQKIFPSKNLNNLLPKNYGTGAAISNIVIKAVYIPNENKDTVQLISKIILFPTDYNLAYLEQKVRFEKQKNQKYAPFKINLYSVDTLIGIPIKRIFEQDIVVQLKEGERYLTYEFPIDQQINFPLEGVFIAFSYFDKSYYEEIGFRTGPAFKTIGISDDSKFKVFQKSFAFCEDDEACKWFRDQYMWDRKNTYYVGLEVY